VLGKGSKIRRLNRELFTLFKERLANLMDCQYLGRIEQPDRWRDFIENSASDIHAYGSRFVVVEETAESACGGPHGNTGATAWTWNLQAGAREDVSKWIRADWTPEPVQSAESGDGDGGDESLKADVDTKDTESLAVQDVLERYIQTHSQENWEECRDVVTIPFDKLHVWAESSGIVVRPEARSYAERMCAVTFSIPYALIWPYLTDDGKRDAETMRNSLP
jgi:hypothetical protein